MNGHFDTRAEIFALLISPQPHCAEGEDQSSSAPFCESVGVSEFLSIAFHRMTSSQFSVGLVALQAPIGENPPVAAATALVEFDEPLPANAVSTHRRIFEVAEKVFRETRRLGSADIGIRESSLPQAVSGASIHSGRGPDGVCQGARVWLSAM